MGRTEGRSRTVLLVEPSSVLRAVMEQLLRAEGYEVVGAESADDALARLRGGLHPCLVLLDVIASRGGLRFRREQLRNRALARVPTVAFSGDHWLRAKAEHLGMPFLEKPIELQSLLAHVAQYCARGPGRKS